MFSDTHCHLSHIRERGEDLAALLAQLDAERVPFIQDIGTKPGDFGPRLDRVREAMNPLPAWLHFSCGLWPDANTIADRHNALAALEADVRAMLDLARSRAGSEGGPAFAALGECGLDRYWNGPAAAERIAALQNGIPPTGGVADDGPGTVDLAGEEELFGLQLDMAKRYRLPVIIHSREAFEPTLGCIRNAAWDVGVIHCWSYGIEEARAFLDRGWYISFPGNVTWPKKPADRELVARLVRYVPRDRLLLETDAPYLTPAPHRGKTNTPALIRHTYAAVAEMLGLTDAALAALVAANAQSLFALGD